MRPLQKADACWFGSSDSERKVAAMSEGRREFLSDLILAWMPFLVVFIAVPIAIKA